MQTLTEPVKAVELVQEGNQIPQVINKAVQVLQERGIQTSVDAQTAQSLQQFKLSSLQTAQTAQNIAPRHQLKIQTTLPDPSTRMISQRIAVYQQETLLGYSETSIQISPGAFEKLTETNLQTLFPPKTP